MKRFKAVIPNQGYHSGHRFKDFALTNKTAFGSMSDSNAYTNTLFDHSAVKKRGGMYNFKINILGLSKD